MKVVIVGGTGTLGTALCRRLSPEHEVIVISRDELKQQAARAVFPEVRFALADVRDRSSLDRHFSGADVVFHVAALKHVDLIEDNPEEAVKTNVLGTINVAEAALAARVRHVVFSSTDKAVLPTNTYGMTKGIGERLLWSINRRQTATKFSVYRWGNVLGSRGSALHAFAKSLKEKGAANLTDPRMTRFWIRIDDAVDFMLETYRNASADTAMIPPMKAAPVAAIVDAVATHLRVKKFRIDVVGIRPGEKIHETIESNHEYCIRSDTSETFDADQLRVLVSEALAC